jgi:glucose-6-phosphate isomerase
LRAQADGEVVNLSEGRPALHGALRSDRGRARSRVAARAQAQAAQQHMYALAASSARLAGDRNRQRRHGGSDLGPRLAVDALQDFCDGRFNFHFLNNADAGATPPG